MAKRITGERGRETNAGIFRFHCSRSVRVFVGLLYRAASARVFPRSSDVSEVRIASSATESSDAKASRKGRGCLNFRRNRGRRSRVEGTSANCATIATSRSVRFPTTSRRCSDVRGNGEKLSFDQSSEAQRKRRRRSVRDRRCDFVVSFAFVLGLPRCAPLNLELPFELHRLRLRVALRFSSAKGSKKNGRDERRFPLSDVSFRAAENVRFPPPLNIGAIENF